MNVQRISAFSYNNTGGNPAGVVIANAMPDEADMLKTAKQVGYSETAFLVRADKGWRIRYFSSEAEVPFCGHATIASGAAIGELSGEGIYRLYLNNGEISIHVSRSNNGFYLVALQSPETWSTVAPQEYTQTILECFSLTEDDLNTDYPAYFAFAGAKHLILALTDRSKLAAMSYDFDRLKALMQQHETATINLIWVESSKVIHSRNVFPPGGVYEDPATGSAAAALAGYLRDINWIGENRFEIFQGQDMGMPSRLLVEYTPAKGESIKVSGETRRITEGS